MKLIKKTSGKRKQGCIIVFDRDDLVESAVLVKNAYEGNIDRINILKNSLDVLAQSLVGMSLEGPWEVNKAYSLIKQSYCFHTLSKRDFSNVLNELVCDSCDTLRVYVSNSGYTKAFISI